MKIGCLALRAHTGIGIEMETVMQHLEKEHEIFVLGFPHEKFGFSAEWNRLNVTRVNDPYKVSNKQVISWIKANRLDLVLSKENTYNPNFFRIAKSMGVSTVASIDPECFDYYHPRWQYCDLIICLTHHSVELVKNKGFHNTAYLPLWGFDLDYFRFIKRKVKNTVHFIHIAGQGNIGCRPEHFRKGAIETVRAFDLASRNYNNIQLTIYTQQAWNEYPQDIQLIVNYNKKINVVETRVKENEKRFRENCNLYKKGHVAIQPSLWEGQGAPIIEALAMGLPVITTDAAPMNEFVQNNNGILVKVRAQEYLSYAPNPQYIINHVDLVSLIESIVFFVRNPDEVERKSLKAREFVEENFGLDITQKLWLEVIERISSNNKNKVINSVDRIKLAYFYYEEEKTIEFFKKILLTILRFLKFIK